MQQSMHELLPEMVWQVGVLSRLDRIIELLESIEVNLFAEPNPLAGVRFAIPDDIDQESTDMTDSSAPDYVNM